MSRTVLSPPGFFGKIPRTGDFVTRRLPAGFVAYWDRWICRHLAARTEAPPLCFLDPATPAGAMTGVVLPSSDRAGRRFPLTLAGPGDAPFAAAWYAVLRAAGETAARGEIDAETLEARLAALPPPAAAGPVARHFLLWRPGQPPLETDPEAPESVLDALFAPTAEAG